MALMDTVGWEEWFPPTPMLLVIFFFYLQRLCRAWNLFWLQLGWHGRGWHYGTVLFPAVLSLCPRMWLLCRAWKGIMVA